MTTSPGPTARALLERHGLRPKKSWGQNFLHDERVITRIVDCADATDQDVVVEIGAGLGALTRQLAVRGGRVLAVERDPDLIPILRSELAAFPATEIVAADAMSFDFAAAAARAGRGLIVLGNLPYQITSPLLFRIIEAAEGGVVVKRAVLMVQKEVAERIVARPGSKTYGRLSVMVQALADAKILFHVGAGAFLPPPNVTSTVFRLDIRAAPEVLAPVQPMFAAVVRAAFAGRRKMLRRALEPAFGAEVAAAALSAANIAGTRRAEELAVVEFARLADELHRGGARAPAASPAEEDADA